MDKLKNVLSSSSRKDGDATQAGEAQSSPTSNLSGQGSHVESSRQAQSGVASDKEHHPIYDQFASNSPSRTTGQSTNTTSLGQNPSDPAKGFGPSATQSTQSSTLHPDTGHGRPGYGGNDISTASIKSGVLGFSQGGDHAALSHTPDLDVTQSQSATGLPDRTATSSQQPDSSHYGRDAALGAGTAGAGAAAAHELHPQRDRDNLRADPTIEQSADKDFAQPSGSARHRVEEPNVKTDTDRSFPLAGGVTSRKQADQSPATQGASHNPYTTEREPGTQGRDAGVLDGHGREALAGAAAYSSTRSGNERRHDGPESTRQGAGLVATSPEELRKEHELRSGHDHHSKGALAGATAAASSLPLTQNQRQHEHDPRDATTSEPLATRELQQPDQSQQGRSHNPEALAAGTAAASALPLSQHQNRREHDPRDTATPGTSATRELQQAEQGQQSRSHHPEALAAGTAAASALPHTQHQHQDEHDLRDTTPGTSAAPELQNLGKTQQSGSHNPEALAGATAATSFIPREKLFGHDHGGRGHEFVGDPCETTDEKPSTGGPIFLDGPHITDTANALDPHLHVPGEFPETPAETPGTGTAGGYIPSSSARDLSSNQRENPSLTSPRTGGTDSSQAPQAEDKHHYGRDAAIAGGVGAAGLGAYGAGKHHQRETTDVGGEPALPSESSPYSSSKLDPRVHGKASALEEQRFDPSARTEPATHESSGQHHGRDAALGAGALGATGLAGHQASKPRDQTRDNSALGTTQSQPPPPVFGSQKEFQTQPQSEHHYGRDAGLAGAGAAAAGGAYYASQRGDNADSGPASSTIGPHKSNVANVLDPRVKPDPALQKQRETGPTYEDPATRTVGPHSSNVANIVDPRVQPDPSKQKQHVTSGPHQSDTLNRLDPKADDKTGTGDKHHYGRDAAVAGGAGAAGYGAYEAAKGYDQHRSTQPSASMTEQRYDPTATSAHDPSQTSQHYYGRDAALAGGAGAAGAGLVAHERNQPSQLAGTQQPHHYETQQPATHQRYDPQQAQDDNRHHDKRNAAAAAGLGAAAGAGGAYAYSNQQEKEAEKERLAQQKAHDKELEHQRKEQQKELEKKQKEEQKAFEKEQAKEKKHHDKVIAAEEKAHEKQVEKEQSKHQHEAEKEQERQRKAAEAEELRRREVAERQHPEEEEEGKKKHGLFGFLHRNKDKKEKETSAENSPRQSREYATAGAATGAAAGGAAAYEGSEHGSHGHERNKLHKDPPPGHPAREAMEAQAAQHEHVGIDGPIGRAGEISGDRETEAGVYGAHELGDQKHTVTEPHTGLPMNVEKYGDGHGGTDGSSNIHGVRNVEGSGQGTGTNWEAIRKANTPY
ncbi:hypothetical protein K491DRAFT_712072 [Lophiostoma macrostomum CBS 122681]|uniref:Uncharacterized protein n=1 Tax=Lophiostoma macrostomum CBS 122681 TaxID=1314788 RepID=A0A6A6TM87_9PLEO|nr:hypothetical protein K491DRAFT_712072 [Lophiostoma macrostomum CBS 122681]